MKPTKKTPHPTLNNNPNEVTPPPGGGARTRIPVCSSTLSLWGSPPPACKAARFRRGTGPRPAGPAGSRSAGGSKVSGPPWGWAAPPGPDRTPPWEGSLCWTCGRAIRRSPGSGRWPGAWPRPRTPRSVGGATAEAGPQSPESWGVRERNGGEGSAGKRRWGRGDGEPRGLLLSNTWSRLRRTERVLPLRTADKSIHFSRVDSNFHLTPNLSPTSTIHLHPLLKLSPCWTVGRMFVGDKNHAAPEGGDTGAP